MMKTMMLAVAVLATASPAYAQDEWRPATLAYFDSYDQILDIEGLRFEDFEDQVLDEQVALFGQSFDVADGVLNHNAGQDRTLTITFSQAVTGFAGRSFLDGEIAGLSVEALFSDGGSETLRPAGATYGNGFYGFVSDKAITSLSFYSTADAGQRWRMADMRFGNFAFGPAPAVPEPGSWALAILGFGVIGATLRRKTGRGAPVIA
jgi:hypothetical protein